MRRNTILIVIVAMALGTNAQSATGLMSIPTQPLEALAPLSPPEVTAEAWLLWDDTFQRELGSLQANEARAMAST
ncbi:MAG: hypothetical protein ACN4GK_06550, partial [Acidimicrobiia bacterium]